MDGPQKWANRIFTGLRTTMTLVDVGQTYPRPPDVTLKLSKLLEQDPRFELLRGNKFVRRADAHEPAVPPKAPAPKPKATAPKPKPKAPVPKTPVAAARPMPPPAPPRAAAVPPPPAAAPKYSDSVEGITSLAARLSLQDEEGAAASSYPSAAAAPSTPLPSLPALALMAGGAYEELPRGFALLGRALDHHGLPLVALNTREPFCLVAVGAQGSGKSHTLSVVLESCMLRVDGVTDVGKAQCALVLHFDASPTSVCEAVGLCLPAPVGSGLGGGGGLGGPTLSAQLPPDALVVLVDPSYYLQRRRFYEGVARVRPLLLDWATLSADHIKRLMGLKETDSQLYVGTMLDVLRDYQRRGVLPDFDTFCDEALAKCDVKGQQEPLRQRLGLLAEFVLQSPKNEPLRREGAGLAGVAASGALVVVDLTNPLRSRAEANGVFQVLVEQFRALALPRGVGKLLALDEAHKFMDGETEDGLSRSIVNAARLMRHEGLRLVVSTQSPKALAPELLELVSIAVLHKFHSPDWMAHLRVKLPVGPDASGQVDRLPRGTALVFAAAEPAGAAQGAKLLRVLVRRRLTRDLGASDVHG